MDIELLKKEFAKDYPDAIWNHQTNNWHEEHHRRSWWPYKAGYERASLANKPCELHNALMALYQEPIFEFEDNAVAKIVTDQAITKG